MPDHEEEIEVNEVHTEDIRERVAQLERLSGDGGEPRISSSYEIPMDIKQNLPRSYSQCGRRGHCVRGRSA